jgi:hypothetical protein
MILFVCLVINLPAQTLHTLVFINKSEKGRETDRTADFNKMTTFINDVSKRLGYTNDLRTHTGSEFTVSNVLSEIRSLNVETNDVVIFYYHGHGTNTSNNTANNKWPSMHITPNGDDLSAATFLEHTTVKQELENVCGQAKLVLCIADCCNRFSYKQNPPSVMGPRYNDNIKRLFMGFNGQKFIMISASKPGQYGYSAKTGSVFGNYFRSAVNYFSEKTNPTWEEVLNRAQLQTKNDNARSGNVSEPQYEIYNKTQKTSPKIIPADVKGDLY